MQRLIVVVTALSLTSIACAQESSWKKHQICAGLQSQTAVAGDFTGDGLVDVITDSGNTTRLFVAPDWQEVVLDDHQEAKSYIHSVTTQKCTLCKKNSLKPSLHGIWVGASTTHITRNAQVAHVRVGPNCMRVQAHAVDPSVRILHSSRTSRRFIWSGRASATDMVWSSTACLRCPVS